MSQSPVLIAGGGIGGLATALTLHQIGVPCLIFETVDDLRPLGVGINLQPNAVRELYDLGLDDRDLEQVGVRCREWALVGLNGNDIYSEPRGLEAGYHWPQYSVHRGEFHMLLYRSVLDRLGPDVFRAGHRVSGYRNDASGVTIQIETGDRTFAETGSLLVGADGIHSAIRAQMYPDQPPLHWGGAIMWRGTSQALPVRTGASFVGLGTHRHRVVFYPISPPDPETGLATINWIAEITEDNSEGWTKGDWNSRAEAEDVVAHFEGWDFGWLDVPALIRSSREVLEYPMIDRDPIPSWRDSNVALLGDAAHPMYPTGSNGATQAIVDARVLGAAILEHGVSEDALKAYDAQLCEAISSVVLRNRGAGPFGILNIVDERCGSVFDDIDDVMSKDEMASFMAGYKQAAGYAIESLNSSPPTIPTDSS
ncbi:MAG: flavin-dependent oxidoreductase [Gammaproteobacteria bacterium]|nr:MAG: flavin-dependent oxidoreductase [Gammaproteobacteria bacterium]